MPVMTDAKAVRTTSATTERRPMIQLTGIEKVYRTDRIETVALTDINLTVGEGEFISIMGPSGCGKSTLLNLMGLLDAPSSGADRAGRGDRRNVLATARWRSCATARSGSSSRPST